MEPVDADQQHMLNMPWSIDVAQAGIGNRIGEHRADASAVRVNPRASEFMHCLLCHG